MTLARLVDQLKLLINGEVWTSQSTLNIVPGRNMTFDQVETKDTSTLTITAGANGTLGYWGNFWDTTNQTISSTTTSYVITLNSSDPDNDGVTVVGGNKIVPTTPAAYNISVSAQVTNTDTQAHEAIFWFRRNGTDIADSASTVTVPSTHGGKNGHLIFYVDLALYLSANDYVQIVWASDNTSVKLETIAAGTSPVYPRSPSLIVSVVQV